MIRAGEALERLRAGNRRFVDGDLSVGDGVGSGRRSELVEGQAPFAVILGCSDSRVPAELVFDQGLGDLFVIRVAGNVAQSSQVGSVEYAAAQLGTRLVVVLGHSSCGAVGATLDHLQAPGESSSPNIQTLVDAIRPAVEPLVTTGRYPSREALTEAAVRANIRAAADHLRHGSAVLKAEAAKGLLVVGAEYSLHTGAVDFFDGLPAS